MGKILILSSQIRHVLKQIDAMDNLTNPTLRHFLTCKLAVKFVNGVKFI